MESRNAGHSPADDKAMTATEEIITRFISGMHRRLVSMKYWGKVPNLSQTTGAVNTWQAMDRDDISQILYIIPRGRALSSEVWSLLRKYFSSSHRTGIFHQSLMTGYKVKIPVIARYES